MGHALSAIDAKGRVSIPAPFRKVIEGNSGVPYLVVGRHEASPCLTGYDRDWSALLRAQIARDEERAHAAGQPFDRHNVNRRAFGLVEDASFDASGRFIMPSFFRAKAQLNDWVLFIGVSDVFEMWSPHVLIATDGIDPETKEIAEHLCKERGVAL